MDSTKLDQRPQPAADADADAVGSGSTSSLPVTKGRFKVKHIKSDPGGVSNASAVVRHPSNEANVPAQDTSVTTPSATASEDKDKQAAAPKKSRFIVKTKTPKEDEGPQDGTSSSALRPTTHPPVTLQQAQGLVRVPSGTNISLLRQPSLPSQHGNRFGHPKEEHIEKLYHMMELNNRMMREILGDIGTPVATESVQQGETTPVGCNNVPSPDIMQHGSAGVPTVVPAPSHPNTSEVSSTHSVQMQRAGSSSVPGTASSADKSMAKLAHHATEIRKEVENATKARRDSNIEIQRLREKCQLLEDKVAHERSKVSTLEERLEKSQSRQRNMATQIEALQQALASRGGHTDPAGGAAGPIAVSPLKAKKVPDILSASQHANVLLPFNQVPVPELAVQAHGALLAPEATGQQAFSSTGKAQPPIQQQPWQMQMHGESFIGASTGVPGSGIGSQTGASYQSSSVSSINSISSLQGIGPGVPFPGQYTRGSSS